MTENAVGAGGIPQAGEGNPDLQSTSTLWKLLWDYDPNGLLVLDDNSHIILVNPAMCQMLQESRECLIGRDAAEFLGDVSDFQRAYAEQCEITDEESSYEHLDLHVRKVIFPVPNARVVAAIFVDVTREWKQRAELESLRRQTADEVRQVVDKQMRVTQEIAGLLGETTAETKVSLLRLLAVSEQGRE